ncbi:C4-dicarboxylate ABC transporter [Betaproteobacteria bacterium]|nr:C4-dicarboxylate ABC transporter [Betaproteobacteria bacterium]
MTSKDSTEASAMALVEEKEKELRVRTLGLFWAKTITFITIVWSLFQMYVTTFSVLDAVRLRVCHILFLLLLSFLLYPAFNKEKRVRAAPTFFDFLCIGAGFFAFIYMLTQYETITLRGGFLLPPDRLAASIGVIITFVMAWRVVGNLALLAGIFLAYCFLGQYIPGAFGHAGFSWNRVMEHMFWGTQGLLGVGVGVSATYIFLFVLFGSFLKYSGFSAFINDLSLTLVGRTAGGPAKVAVIASALMGMINGSALANVATTGAITIPLMKRTGYKSEFAGAVEAVASTGGQFAPPIMGAVGFIMAEFLGVPYTRVMLAAAIPAFLYYLALLAAVHYEARKLGLRGLSREHIPDAMRVIKTRGHLIIPLVVLMAVLFMGYTPLYAAVVSIISTVLASWLSKDTRMNLTAIVNALEEGARGAVGVGAACVIIGIIIGTVSLTGLGLTFGYEVLNFVKEGQLYLCGIFVMLMSIILGMGVPGVAAYVIVAAVAVPVLVKVGADPLAAHMFCLFYACLSNITPPVAMSSFVAAGIAHSNQTQTSLIAVRLGLSGFILPFFFLDNNLLLYNPEQDTLRTLWAILSASLGVSALAAGLEGWLLGPCSLPMRLILLITALLAIDPSLTTDAVGIILFVVVLFWSHKTGRKHALSSDSHVQEPNT